MHKNKSVSVDLRIELPSDLSPQEIDRLIYRISAVTENFLAAVNHDRQAKPEDSNNVTPIKVSKKWH